jgi:hypothetical protein
LLIPTGAKQYKRIYQHPWFPYKYQWEQVDMHSQVKHPLAVVPLLVILILKL